MMRRYLFLIFNNIWLNDTVYNGRNLQSMKMNPMMIPRFKYFRNTARSYLYIPLILFFSLSLQAQRSKKANHGKPDQQQQFAKELDSIYDHILSVYELPGFAIGILKDGNIIYARGFGVSNIETKVPLTTESVFHMASVSKPFVAAGIMQMAEKGRIQLDSPLIRYLPYFKLDDERYKSITIRQMLIHTSGIPDVQNYEWDKPQNDDRALERYVQSLSSLKLDFKPGARNLYSNLAYDILADVIAKISGVPFETYMEQNILIPCGMKNSTFLMPAGSLEQWVSPHIFGGALQYQVSKYYPYNRMHAASSTLHSNIEDMMNFARMNLNEGTVNGKMVLTPASFKEMIRPQLKVNENTYVGLSWGIYVDSTKKRKIGHSGSDPGFTTNFMFYPEDSIAIVLLGNLSRFFPYNLITSIAYNKITDKTIPEFKKPVNLILSKTMRVEDIEAAKKQYQDLKRYNFNEYDFREENLQQLGVTLFLLGKTSEAIEIFLLNTDTYPKSATAFYYLAEAYAKAGNNEKAIESYKKTASVDSNYKALITERLKAYEARR